MTYTATDPILTAVNDLLQGLSLRPVLTYTDGQAAEAVTLLDRWSGKIQGTGWHCNTEDNVTLSYPDLAITYSSISGTFLAGETVTEATSGATGRYQYIESGALRITTLTGTFTGGKRLTGSVSAAIANGVTITAATSGKIYVDYDILSADAVDNSYPDVTLRAGRFYQRGDNTDVFTDPLRITQIRKLPFVDLPESLRDLITVNAMIDFCAKNKLPIPDDAQKRLRDARFLAFQEQQDAADINLADSPYFLNMSGRRGSSTPAR